MYSKILFAVDEDESLEAAIRVLAAYAQHLGSAVHVIHAHRIDAGVPGSTGRQLVPAVIERLHEAAVLLDRLGYPPERQDSDGVAEALGRWAMDEFLSLRLLPPGQIDPALLDALRSRAGASWAYTN